MLKKLSASIRQYKRQSLLAPLFVTFEVILEVLIPTIMAYLIDNGINKGDMNVIAKTGLILVVTCIISLICGI